MSDVLLKVTGKQWKEIVKPVINGERFGRLPIPVARFLNFSYRHRLWIVHRKSIVGYFNRVGQFSWMKSREQIRGLALWHRSYVPLDKPIRRPMYDFPSIIEGFDIEEFKKIHTRTK